MDIEPSDEEIAVHLAGKPAEIWRRFSEIVAALTAGHLHHQATEEQAFPHIEYGARISRMLAT